MGPAIDSKELTAVTSAAYTCVLQVLKCNLRVRFCDHGSYKSVLICSRISTCLVFSFPCFRRSDTRTACIYIRPVHDAFFIYIRSLWRHVNYSFASSSPSILAS